MSVFRVPKFQAFDAAGAPLASGKAYFFAAGTSTPKDSYPTFDDAAATTNANANPVILDSKGQADIWPGTGKYKVRIKMKVRAIVMIAEAVVTPAMVTAPMMAAAIVTAAMLATAMASTVPLAAGVARTGPAKQQNRCD